MSGPLSDKFKQLLSSDVVVTTKETDSTVISSEDDDDSLPAGTSGVFNSTAVESSHEVPSFSLDESSICIDSNSNVTNE